MRNKLSDLNDHLFAAIERLNDEGLDPERIPVEAARGKAIAELAEKSLAAGRLALDAAKLAHEAGGRDIDLPAMLEGPDRR